MENFYEVIPRLYIGPIEASTDFEEIKKKNITIIVNCTKDIDNKFELRLLKPIEEAPSDVQYWLMENSYYIKYHRIPVDDNGTDEEVDIFYKHVVELLPQIEYLYQYGKSILVHCLAGNQRSAAFICAFLMYHSNLVYEEAIGLLLQKKPNVFFFGKQINFDKALLRIDQEILDDIIKVEKVELGMRRSNYNPGSAAYARIM